MPCQICGNNQVRSASHVVTTGHKRKLIAFFKKIKEKKIEHPLSKYYT